MNLKGYFRENWGTPFVIAFVVLLIASAAELGVGSSDLADSVAVYAFYSLVIGVALQIASYVRYGEALEPQEQGVPSEPAPFHWTRRKALALGIVVILVAGTGVALLYPQSPVPAVIEHRTYPKLVLTLAFVDLVQEPGNFTVASFGMSASGGAQPYNFTARWADNLTQSGSTGVFTRTFSQSEEVPASAVVTVTSTDGQTTSLTVPIANSSSSANSG